MRKEDRKRERQRERERRDITFEMFPLEYERGRYKEREEIQSLKCFLWNMREEDRKKKKRYKV